MSELRLGGHIARVETLYGTLLFGARYEQRRLDLPGRFDSQTLHELKPSLALLHKQQVQDALGSGSRRRAHLL